MSVFQDCNPATGECIAEIPITSPAELQASVERARRRQRLVGHAS